MISDSDYARRADILASLCDGLRQAVPWLSPRDFQQQRREGTWTIVDVRSLNERRVSTIPGAVSKDAFEARLDEYTDDHILVYCTVGCRSGAYTRELRRRGLNALNLRGGVLAWALNGGPFVNPDGQLTKRVHVHGQPMNVLSPDYQAVG